MLLLLIIRQPDRSQIRRNVNGLSILPLTADLWYMPLNVMGNGKSTKRL